MTDFMLLTIGTLTSPGCSINSQRYSYCNPHHCLMGKVRICYKGTWHLSKEQFKKQSLKLLEPKAPPNCALWWHYLWRQHNWKRGSICYTVNGAPLELFQEARLAKAGNWPGLKCSDLGLETKRCVVLFQHVLWTGSTLLLQDSQVLPFK